MTRAAALRPAVFERPAAAVPRLGPHRAADPETGEAGAIEVAPALAPRCPGGC